MNYIKSKFENLLDYIKTFFKWIVLAAVVGAIGGIVGSLFHISVDYVTELHLNFKWLIFLLPIGGLFITAMYRLFRSKADSFQAECYRDR